MDHLARFWLSMVLSSTLVTAAAVAAAQSKAAGQADAPPQCADVGNAYDALERSVEKTYQKAIAHEQNEINSRIAELASADRAKKPELIKHIEAREAEILSLRAELLKTKTGLDNAKTKALKKCVADVEGPPQKPSLAERCGITKTRATDDPNQMPLRLSGDDAAQRHKAAELIASELGAKLVTTTWDKLVRGGVLGPVVEIESIVTESSKRSVVVLVEGRHKAPAPRAARRPWDFEGLPGFFDARLARFGGILLLSLDSGSLSSSTKMPRPPVIHATTDGRALATMICRAPRALCQALTQYGVVSRKLSRACTRSQYLATRGSFSVLSPFLNCRLARNGQISRSARVGASPPNQGASSDSFASSVASAGARPDPRFVVQLFAPVEHDAAEVDHGQAHLRSRLCALGLQRRAVEGFVDVLDDDGRIRHREVAVAHQRRALVRIVLLAARIGFGNVRGEPLEGDPFFVSRQARAPGERTERVPMNLDLRGHHRVV